jgi:hypothetical protein
MRFDRETLELIDREREVRIETVRPDGSRQRTIIWAVVDGGDVFVRSWRGDRAHWYQAALDKPGEIVLLVDDRRITARARPATDDESVARCSTGLERKYAANPSTPSMLRAEILGTTLRLGPREGNEPAAA